ncbi:hypothetical protein [Elusimicrobium minutum]|nr:hypothetical protein [Elusimicrobium minutum]
MLKKMFVITFVVLGVIMLASCAANRSYDSYTKLTSYPSVKESQEISELYFNPSENPDENATAKKIVSSAENGNPVALYLLGDAFYEGEEYKEAAKTLRKSAVKGFSTAQYKYALANMRIKGKKTETYAFLLLSCKSGIKEIRVAATKLLVTIEIKEKDKEKAQTLAAAIENTYLPEFKKQIDETEKNFYTAKRKYL